MSQTKDAKEFDSLKGRASTLQKLVDSMPTSILILHLNSTIKLLERRGVAIRDWDDKDKIMRYIRNFGGRYYFMATKKSKEAHDHGNNNADQTEESSQEVPLSALPSER